MSAVVMVAGFSFVFA